MSKAYFDSSVVLAMLLAEPNGSEAAEIWNSHAVKLASVLLSAECTINLRRYHAQATRSPAGWLQRIESYFDEIYGGLVTKEVDGEILAIIRREKILAECRTLDAIHLATALYFREKAEEDIRMVSFDRRFSETARRLKFKVVSSAAAR